MAPMTFQELCRVFRVSRSEAVELMHFLAAYRARRTVEQLTPLLPGSDAPPWMLDVLRTGLGDG